MEQLEILQRLSCKKGISQSWCPACIKGFENHEYFCTDQPGCIDHVESLKATRHRLRKLCDEAKEEIRTLTAKLKDEKRKTLDESIEAIKSIPIDKFKVLKDEYENGRLGGHIESIYTLEKIKKEIL